MQQEREKNISVMDQLDIVDEKGVLFIFRPLTQPANRGRGKCGANRYGQSMDAQRNGNENFTPTWFCCLDFVRYPYKRTTVSYS